MTIVSPRDRLFTVETFLAWDGFDPDHHYQLIDGRIVMMAPTSRNHAWLLSALVRMLGNATLGGPFRVMTDAGLVRPGRPDRWFEADLLVTDEPLGEGLAPFTRPVLVAEVLSPSSEAIDRTVKLPDYRSIPSVREVLLVDQRRPCLEIHRRLDDGRWETVFATGYDGAAALTAVPATIHLADLYRDIPLASPPETP